MKKRSDLATKLVYIVLLTLLIFVVVSIIAIEIYVWVRYGEESPSEIPLWALYFMLRG